jgi:cytochrome c oxidase assembly protein subunit 15
VKDSTNIIPPVDRNLAWFAKLVVALTLWLIFIGGHTTTTGAGMAFPDWPLSHGSLNPDGWWADAMMRLEHGHRIFGGVTALLVGILCARVWRSMNSVPLALLVGLGFAAIASVILKQYVHPQAVRIWAGLIGIVSSAFAFRWLLRHDLAGQSAPRSKLVREVAFAAFTGVCLQAALGGLRVVLDPGGVAAIDDRTATIFRVAHGCLAQIELCLVVALAALLSPKWQKLPRDLVPPRAIRILAWLAVAALFGQLLAGAAMRHLGAGLAIPTFPEAQPNGSWMPTVHNLYVDLNFTHTRVGALIVTVVIVALAWRTLTGMSSALYKKPAWALLTLVFAQALLGMFVIWKNRPAIVTTLHVVNGAVLLATTILLTVRLAKRATVTASQARSTSSSLIETAG